MRYLYIIVFFISVALALPVGNNEQKKPFVRFLLIIMTAMLMFRYGQGPDYFGYNYIFVQNQTFKDFIQNSADVHGEIGFRLLSLAFRGNFKLFVAVCAVYNMYMLYRFLRRYSYNESFAVMMFIPTIWVTYFFSAMRQGIVLATFLGIGVSFLYHKKYFQYILMCLVLSLIHSVALILLVMIISDKVSLKKLVCAGLPGSLIVGIFIGTSAGRTILSLIPVIGSKIIYYLQVDISVMAIAEKTISLAVVLLLYYNSEYSKKTDYNWWMNAYVLGCIIFYSFVMYSLISARVLICFKVLELMIVPNLLYKTNKFRQIVCLYFIVLSFVMYYHNISASINQVDYHSDINVMNYPYVSVFNCDKIWEYREEDMYYPLIKHMK